MTKPLNLKNIKNLVKFRKIEKIMWEKFKKPLKIIIRENSNSQKPLNLKIIQFKNSNPQKPLKIKNSVKFQKITKI